MAHAGWRGLRLLLLAAVVGVGLLAVAPEASAATPDYWIAVDLRDQHRDCDGDSARISVTVSIGGPVESGFEPVEGVVLLVSGNLEEDVLLPPTDARGRTRGRITPSAGSSANFTYRVDTPDSRVLSYRIGYCPFVPGPNRVSFDAQFEDDRGRPVRGERASIQTGGYRGTDVPPHWTRSNGEGVASWDGIPSFWAHEDDEFKINTLCLDARSRYRFAEADERTLILDGQCIRDFPAAQQSVQFRLERK